MKLQESRDSSSGSEVSYEEILDELLEEFDHKKISKFTSEEQIRLTLALK